MRAMLTRFLIPSLTHQLTALSGYLDKAGAHLAETGGNEHDLLMARLAPDMFPLYGQLRFAAFLASEAVYKLRFEDVPERIVALRTSGASGRDEPGDFAEHRAAIEDALGLLAGVGEDELDAAAERPLAHALPRGGMVFDMTGLVYARDWALPQVDFHCVAAYCLLRAAGVPLGKRDYVPHMWAYLRPGTAPAS